MQRHEGPRRDKGADERARQAGLTRGLLKAIAVLCVTVAAMAAFRFL